MAHDTIFTVTQPALLLAFLIEKLPGKGRNKVKALLTHRQVSVDDKVVTRHDHPLASGQRVTIYTVGQGARRSVGESLYGIKILFEDDDLIVIDKPPGLLSIASETERERTAYRVLMDHVQRGNPQARVFIVHRLDRDTSGVMMFAKREVVKQVLQDGWREIVSERSYVAAVEGPVTLPTGTIGTWLKESKTRTMYVSAPSADARWAETHYQVLRTSREYSLLEVRLETGRKNQIRVHLQHIGHSVVGDKRYGAKTDPLKRLGLHARVLYFRHPMNHRELRFETDIPASFQRLVRAQGESHT